MKLSRLIIKWLPVFSTTRRRLLSRIYEQEYREAIAAARREKDSAKVEELQQERAFDQQEDYEWEEVRFTRTLLRDARHLRVDIPSRPVNEWHSDHWIMSQSQGDWYLTRAGVAKVREAIRSEQRWRREQRSHNIAWLTAISGLVGTLIGLVAVLSKFFSAP